jgi:toxin YhaV
MNNQSVINGWSVFSHPCFDDQFEALVKKVERLKNSHPETFQKKAETKLLAAVVKVVKEQICLDPSNEKFRQGETLGTENKHWFRAKFLGQYRLFFRYSAAHKIIVLVWINDNSTLRAYDSKSDAYKMFAKMLKTGYPPDSWEELLTQCLQGGQSAKVFASAPRHG